MQSKEEIEKSYETPDPWNYSGTMDDMIRRHYVVSVANMLRPAALRVIDLCAGEGWLTTMLPGAEIHAIELSDNAAARFPKNVKRVLSPIGKYDLVVATGYCYPHYNLDQIISYMRAAARAGSVIITSNIEPWEHLPTVAKIPGTQIFEASFPYREWKQKLRVFTV